MTAIIEAFWPLHLVLFTVAYVWCWQLYDRHPQKRHIRVIGVSYLILVAIDTYTILVEDYPLGSVKAYGMIVAFILGDFALHHLLFQQVGRTHENTLHGDRSATDDSDVGC